MFSCSTAHCAVPAPSVVHRRVGSATAAGTADLASSPWMVPVDTSARGAAGWRGTMM